MGPQSGFDLAGLDPEPADLDLVVGPAREHQLPVRRPSGQVAGAVHALARAERAGHEPLTRQTRPADIPARQPGTRDVQLTHNAHGRRCERLVQHV
ncbi:hypothetical protein, partial [Actinomadura sp. NBRC 104425]|uniref:hypothetical protein n=1 Tax=Actinomadura sp. NBRC 104425 TaxID=3032204 RepID=UPI003331FDCB